MSAYNPVVNQGIDWIFTTTWQDSTGTAINTTGYAVQLQIRNQVNNSLLLSLSVGSGITLTTPASGITTYRATGTQTAAISVGTYNYGIKATSAGGINYDWADGTITIAASRVQ
jgi:hypothetical protein